MRLQPRHIQKGEYRLNTVGEGVKLFPTAFEAYCMSRSRWLYEFGPDEHNQLFETLYIAKRDKLSLIEQEGRK